MVPGLDASRHWHPNSPRNMFTRLMANRTNKCWNGRTTIPLAASNAVPQSVVCAIPDSAADIPTELQDAMFLGNVQYRLRHPSTWSTQKCTQHPPLPHPPALPTTLQPIRPC